MLLNKINYKYIDKNIYDKKYIDLRWHTFETEEKRKVLYSIREDGLVISTNKKTYMEKIIKPVLSNGVLVVRINRKVYKVKQLVTKYFMENYFDGCCVLHKDCNPYNCQINNLIICSKKESGERTGGKANKKSITFAGKKYDTITSFCKQNYIGIRTYYDYKQKRYNHSILEDIKRSKQWND